MEPELRELEELGCERRGDRAGIMQVGCRLSGERVLGAEQRAQCAFDHAPARGRGEAGRCQVGGANRDALGHVEPHHV